MPYTYPFDYEKFAAAINQEIADTPGLNGEKICRIIRAREGDRSGFNSKRVSEARLRGKAAKNPMTTINPVRIQQWVYFFDHQHPQAGWTMDKFIEEFKVEGYHLSQPPIEALQQRVETLETEVEKLKQAIAHLQQN